MYHTHVQKMHARMYASKHALTCLWTLVSKSDQESSTTSSTGVQVDGLRSRHQRIGGEVGMALATRLPKIGSTSSASAQAKLPQF
jgi:hypothetical protein